MSQFEDLILEDDQRGVSGLRPHLAANFVHDAAGLIAENIGTVLITTGFYIRSAGVPETDGPPGAAALAHAIRVLNGTPVFVTDAPTLPIMTAITDGTEVIDFPITSHFESAEFARALLAERSPSVLISIERAGFAKDGTYRNMRNADISEWTARIDHLFDQHPRSVGIGDGGNEIGMGNLFNITSTMPELHPNPCVTTTSKLVIASCSNWGGYAVSAALSLISGKNLTPSPEQVEDWINRCVAAGAVDGISAKPLPMVDGKPLTAELNCVENLHRMVKDQGVE